MKLFSRRRRTLSALAALCVTTAGGAALVHDGKVVAAAAPAMKPAVTITNYSFKPGTVTVKQGATVTWTNKDDDVHTIKSTDGPEAFNSPALESGSRFGYTFHHAGTYHYICTVHPYMHGVIVVR
ncbi:MAG TPA: cupredoxin domain-containing protein [Steroidobacteraceae bacterium]|nr:cupredoxin domain-containing protein [Steroidobacteraceae bacterium]